MRLTWQLTEHHCDQEADFSDSHSNLYLYACDLGTYVTFACDIHMRYTYVVCMHTCDVHACDVCM